MSRIPPGKTHFLLLKLHSLTGLVPIGVYLVVHLSVNSLRTVGVLPYQLSIDVINNLPFLVWIETLFIYIPLLFHSFMGFYLTKVARYNVLRYPYPRNGLYTLQRLTGAVVFLFLVYHVGTTVVPKWTNGKHLFEAAPFLIDQLNREFGSWTGRILYLIGILSATFHFANGLWGFCISWGVVVGRRAQRNAAWAFSLVGLVLTVMGLATVYEFSVNPQSTVPTVDPARAGAGGAF